MLFELAIQMLIQHSILNSIKRSLTVIENRRASKTSIH